MLRALALLEGFTLTPQLQITEPGLYAVVDLGSEDLMLAVEADGFEHHGTRRALRKDCRRHTELAVFGWSTLRFPSRTSCSSPRGPDGRCGRGVWSGTVVSPIPHLRMLTPTLGRG